MKNLLLILTISLTLSCCKNDDNTSTNSIDQLPPATQTGEQTFGCLINGEAFIPDTFGSGRPNAFYQFVDGKYFLGISASNRIDGLKSIGIGADDILIEENTVYQFTMEDGDNPAFYARHLLGGGLDAEYVTTTIYNGEIKITRFDPENFIISGTFWFDAEEITSSEIVKITEGRFDMLYTN